MKTDLKTVDEYIKLFSEDVQAILEKVRATADGLARCINETDVEYL